MQTYILLLRGINVGGHKKIKMEDLRQRLHAAGYIQVRTYIQSGNILLDWDGTDGLQLAADIRAQLLAWYGFEVPTLVRSRSEWAGIIAAQPFGAAEQSKLHVSLLDVLPHAAAAEGIDLAALKTQDEFALVGQTIYLHCPNGYGNTKLTNEFWERKLKCAATTRNWNTVLALQAMLDATIG